MPEIIHIGGNYWGYTPERCDTCPHLERSLPDEEGDTLVACDAPDGICRKTGEQVYG